VSDEVKASPLGLGHNEAIEGIAVKRGKRRKAEDVFERNRLQHQSILALLVAKHIGQRQVQSERVTNHTVDSRPEGAVTCRSPKPGA
jgi:hypothetical protein